MSLASVRGSCDVHFEAESVCRRELRVEGAQGRWTGGRLQGRVNISFTNGSRHSLSISAMERCRVFIGGLVRSQLAGHA